MSDIVDVKVIEEKAIIVSFADGTNEKATLDKEDKFNLEQGISICITKKLLEEKCRNGSNLYNKIVKRAEKVYTQKIETLKSSNPKKKKKRELLLKNARKMSSGGLNEKWLLKKNRLKFKKKPISEQCMSTIRVIKII